MDNDATLVDSSSQLPQKRVLPSRSRRGGPGVGNCDVDVLILNAQLHKLENEPLIPADTPFVFKTNDTLEKVAAEFSSAGGSGLVIRAHESYFDRPDVLKAYREQTMIETPEYTGIPESSSVGGRLRVRTTDETNTDLDAAYEKRHKKYEKFEKGQRLREKEKLKHAQYKLKERIEQLRGMDNSAFMQAPASSFSPRPGVPEVIEDDVLGGLNGNPAYLEGERRRKEMLTNAQALEERYRILLPPDRQRKPTTGISNDPDSELSGKEFVRPHDDGESDLEEDVSKKESQKLKLKLPARPSLGMPITTPKTVSTTSKKRRKISPSSVPPPPPKAPAARKPSKIRPVFTVEPMGESGPSSLGEAIPPNSAQIPRPDGDVMSSRFIPYVPTADYRPKRNKRAKTDERGVPSSRDHGDYPSSPSRHGDYSIPPPQTEDYSAPHPQHGNHSLAHPEQHIVVDEEPISTSSKRSSSPIHGPPLSYSYPPPRPLPPSTDPSADPSADPDYPSPETTVPPADSLSNGPVSPMDSDPGPNDSNDFSTNDFSALLHPPTPSAEDASYLSVPPVAEPIAVERKPSVPPIESISAPVTIVSRRGRSRGGGVAKSVVPRKTPQRRRGEVCYITTFAERAAKNPRHRRLEAFGVKLPPIIANSNDSYDYELPPEIFDTTKDPKDRYKNEEHDGDVTQEAEGSEAPEDEDEDGPEPEEGQDQVEDEDAGEDRDEYVEDSDGGT
ncbi:hypothetical protein DFH08DRAFT_844060 [Mycena albidolilacea]|uniref:PEHE domain-containing protein n=1 Tax=Mycena albidolilacea TaxID=1033008 RepID=A0AAD7AKP9_9AGAR|nr:hypothetical protein DFH08DRAFT_844060 [Mycena albidolilacea]